MTVVHLDPDLAPDRLRGALYRGDLAVFSQLRSVATFVAYVRDELERLFAPHCPEEVHRFVDPARMAHLLGSWKPGFIHAERSKRLTGEIIREAGFPSGHTHYDLPKPRTAFPVGHLTTGMAFAFPWHRDVWYSAPGQQINWWLPIYAVRGDNAMSFDPGSFDQRVANNSDRFDYYRNNVLRASTVTTVEREHQVRPQATDHRPAQELVVLPRPGDILLFSAAQLHRSIANTSEVSRFSVDFRTVDVGDLLAHRGAPLVDAACTGTAIRDFRRVGDDSPIDESTIVELFGPPPPGAVLVFEPAD